MEHDRMNLRLSARQGGSHRGPTAIAETALRGHAQKILQHYQLGAEDYLIEVGCRTGLLAKDLSDAHRGLYLGLDNSPQDIEQARRRVTREGWRFEVADNCTIPEIDSKADLVCFFSVLNHLRTQHIYLYLEEARRVLRKGGRVIFSFFEYAEPTHWPVFTDSVESHRTRTDAIPNTFLSRSEIAEWARHLTMGIEEFRAAHEKFADGSSAGQAICVLKT